VSHKQIADLIASRRSLSTLKNENVQPVRNGTNFQNCSKISLPDIQHTGKIIITIIIVASHEDEMNDKYNDKLCTSNEVIQ